MTVHKPRPPRALLLAAAVALAVVASGCASERAFREAQDHEQMKHWDLAVMAYQKAASLDPANKKYESSASLPRPAAGHPQPTSGGGGSTAPRGSWTSRRWSSSRAWPSTRRTTSPSRS